ncbi:MAG: M23 family metallopeptidase [Clostridiales bacterium]|nr:M23 family metallopeptidase [Clostridiales bacterium]
MDEVMNMNRRTWKEFFTKRSTIWTLSLCLVGAIVLGSMAAVNSSRNNDAPQVETELGQLAYLEEELDGENTNDEDIDVDSSNASPSTTDGSSTDNSGDAVSTNGEVTDSTADGDENVSDVSTDLVLGDDSITDTNDSADTEESTVNSNPDDDASSDSEEASSASIISEQALIDAGISFSDEQSLLWPSAGTIAIDYSMDKSVYFATLNQYKYNPALVISSDTGNQVLAAAKGIVESISVDEETGTTLVLNIGNGYRLIYGQLMEPAVSEGDVVEAGDLLAYISEPTKYYSTEGSNLYFAMTKDGEPVDPVLYLE